MDGQNSSLGQATLSSPQNASMVNQSILPASAMPQVAPAQLEIQSVTLPKASILRRFAAIVIDGLLFIPLAVVLTIVIGPSASSTSPSSLVLSFLFLVYDVFFIGKYGATLGKKWLKIRVVGTDNQKIDFVKAFLREVIGKFLSAMILGLGYFWAMWDKNRQAWHDKIADTYVVSTAPQKQ
ncbi:RDD family protein [Patescibacteria group bacterium]|nr:RDD family protein [Patescibacteria group bacterium]